MTESKPDVSNVSRGTATESDLPRGLGKPAERAFAAAGYTQLADFTRVRETDLLQLHGVGPKAVGILRATLAAQGRAFADGDPGDR